MIRAFLLSLAALVACTPATAQMSCAPHDRIVAGLEQRYGEVRQGAGLRLGEMIELWASPEGTWTLVAVRADGLACIVADGTDWMADAPEAKGGAL